jgi:undecaprenyl pyrophosphate synthase
MKSCNYSTKIFQEAIDHCRWKKVLYSVLKKINIVEYENKTFEEIICAIYNICDNVKGVGMLTIYDISSEICRYHKTNIKKVYIIGNGPKRAVKILNIKTKIHKINDKIRLNFVEIIDVINAFDINKYELDKNIRNTKNGDIMETYICNWQKNK